MSSLLTLLLIDFAVFAASIVLLSVVLFNLLPMVIK